MGTAEHLGWGSLACPVIANKKGRKEETAEGYSGECQHGSISIPIRGPAWIVGAVLLEPFQRPLIPAKREANPVRPVAHGAAKNYTPLAVWQQGRKRTAANTPLQGTAADLIKLAMIRIDAALAQRGLQTAMLLQVHDELLFESPPSELDEIRALVKSEMENVAKLEVPLIADLGSGPNWRDAK